MSTSDPAAGTAAPSEEELRQAYEAELKKLRVEHVLIEHVVAMINVGMLRAGLAPGTEDERDPDQVRLAIESIRGLMPVLEQAAPQQIGQIRSALSQLQLAYVKIGGAPAEAGASGEGSGAGGSGGTGGPGGPGGAGGPGGPRAGGEPGDTGGPRGTPGAERPPAAEPAKPGEPGPAQRSGRLWVPGQ